MFEYGKGIIENEGKAGFENLEFIYV